MTYLELRLCESDLSTSAICGTKAGNSWEATKLRTKVYPDVSSRTMSYVDEEEVRNIDSALLSRADLLDAEYPNRPRNSLPTLKFRDLVCSLLEAMVELQHKPKPRKGAQYSVHEARQNIIYRFIQRWRNEVGPDIYPAFRLIMPDRDKDRPMYGLKEASLGKMLVSVRSPNPINLSQT